MDIPPGTLSAPAPVASPPAGLTERLLPIHSEGLSPLTPDASGRVHSDGTYASTDGQFAVLHVFIDGQDVTYWGGVPTDVGEWSCAEPGCEDYATIDFPGLTPMHTPGTGTLSWLHHDAPVELSYIKGDATRVHRFSGFLVSDNTGNDEGSIRRGWHVQGLLNAADLIGNRVPTYLDPTDIGTLIAGALNSVPSRRYGTVAPVTTGILSRQRGSYQDTVWDYVQSLLSTGWTSGGQQWTLKRTGFGLYAIALKDTTTVHWTVTVGAHGVSIDLTSDKADTVNAIYGRGVGPDGYAWAGWCYPNLLPDDAPIYPNTDLRLITSGTTDAGTDSGDGVSTWQRRVNAIGYSLAVDGNYGAADVATARAIQVAYGLTIDGILGPQTWAATFDVGSHGGDLSGAYRRPLAIDLRVDPFLYAANGAVVGANPDYNPSVIRRERHIDFGSGVTKAEATVSAQYELARELDPGWAGRVDLRTDPVEGSRFLIEEGQNVLLRGYRGANHLLHVARVTPSPKDSRVTLDVDSKFRDAMTLSSILQRDRDSAPDPGRRPGNVNRRSRQEQDMAVEFDGEAGGGIIPRHAVFSNLWTVIRIPVSQVGRLKIIQYHGGAEFCIALFANPILPSNLHALVGNPLTATTSPWDAATPTLEDQFGWIEAWGGTSDDVGGYWPLKKATGPFTGDLKDTNGVEYDSSRPPWVWVAEIAAASTFLEGRLFPAPVI